MKSKILLTTLFITALLLLALGLTGCFAAMPEGSVPPESAENADIPVAGFDMFALLKVAAGIYLLYGAVRGKGKFFENEYPKCSREKYVLIMRISSVIAGALVVADGVTGMLGVFEAGSTAQLALFWVAIGSVVAIIVINVVLTDRKAMEQARMRSEAEARRSRAHAAFDFEDDAAAKDDAENQ